MAGVKTGKALRNCQPVFSSVMAPAGGHPVLSNPAFGTGVQSLLPLQNEAPFWLWSPLGRMANVHSTGSLR